MITLQKMAMIHRVLQPMHRHSIEVERSVVPLKPLKELFRIGVLSLLLTECPGRQPRTLFDDLRKIDRIRKSAFLSEFGNRHGGAFQKTTGFTNSQIEQVCQRRLSKNIFEAVGQRATTDVQ
ncbi:MAG: hypothetical protein PHP44_01870 [Kiritimatiellae bacterium]|nr:hypothetical protein [Kiritimatiellia bacterium]